MFNKVRTNKMIALVVMVSFVYASLFVGFAPAAEAVAGRVVIDKDGNKTINNNNNTSGGGGDTSNSQSKPVTSFLDSFTRTMGNIAKFVNTINMALGSVLTVGNEVVNFLDMLGIFKNIFKTLGWFGLSRDTATPLSQMKGYSELDKFAIVQSLQAQGAYHDGMSAAEMIACTYVVEIQGKTQVLTCKQLEESGFAVVGGRVVATNNPISKNNNSSNATTPPTYMTKVRVTNVAPLVITPFTRSIYLMYDIVKIPYNPMLPEEIVAKGLSVEYPVEWAMFEPYLGCNRTIPIPVVFRDPNGNIVQQGYELTNMTVVRSAAVIGSNGADGCQGAPRQTQQPPPYGNTLGLGPSEGYTPGLGPGLGSPYSPTGPYYNPYPNSGTGVPSIDDLHGNLNGKLGEAQDRLGQANDKYNAFVSDVNQQVEANRTEHQLRAMLYQAILDYDYLGACLQHDMVANTNVAMSFRVIITDVFQSMFNPNNEELRKIREQGTCNVNTIMEALFNDRPDIRQKWEDYVKENGLK